MTNTLSIRFVDTLAERPRWRFTYDRRFNDRLIWGFEFNPAAEEVNWLRGNYDLLKETERLPLVSLGVSSDRIYSKVGTLAYYATIAKTIPNSPVSPYFSIKYSENDKKWGVPVGATIDVAQRIKLVLLNDGKLSHGLLTYTAGDWWTTVGTVGFSRMMIAFGFAW